MGLSLYEIITNKVASVKVPEFASFIEVIS